MKNKLTLVVIVPLLLFVLCSCSFPHKQPDEKTTEPTAPPVTETASAAEESSAPQADALFFRLAELPEIGPYYDGIIYKRMSDQYVDAFQPSSRYGAVVPYIGDYRPYKSVYSEEETGFDGNYPRYGLMTADGTVITDAVYDYAYTSDGLIFLSQSAMKGGKESFHKTIVPFSGKWAIEKDCAYEECLWTYASEKDQRIVLFDYDSGVAEVYDYNGKLLFTKKNVEQFEGTYDTGLFVMNTKMSSADSRATLLDKNGKTIVETDGQIALFGGSTQCFTVTVEKKKLWSTDEYDTDSFYGLIKRDGSWLLQPKYKSVTVLGDKYITYDDGKTMTVCDINLKPITRRSSSEADSMFLELFNGEMIYRPSGMTETQYYTLVDDRLITAEGKELVEVDTIAEANLFFGKDGDGVGYLFTLDGTVKKTFANADRYAGFLKKGTFEIITGSEKRKTSHVIDAKTLKEVFTYTFFDGTYECFQNEGGWGSEGKRFLTFYRWAEEKNLSQPYLVMDLSTGKVLADHCDYAATYEIAGKEYYVTLRDHLSVTTDSSGRVLLRMPYAYLD